MGARDAVAEVGINHGNEREEVGLQVAVGVAGRVVATIDLVGSTGDTLFLVDAIKGEVATAERSTRRRERSDVVGSAIDRAGAELARGDERVREAGECRGRDGVQLDDVRVHCRRY